MSIGNFLLFIKFVLIITLSAPFLIRKSTSLIELIPPPIEIGTKQFFNKFGTDLRFSLFLVIFNKTISSIPQL